MSNANYVKPQELHCHSPDCRATQCVPVVSLADYEQLHAEFKNFHRLLCDRFGYGHDAVHWQRDQLSLIEFIWNNPPPRKICRHEWSWADASGHQTCLHCGIGNPALGSSR